MLTGWSSNPTVSALYPVTPLVYGLLQQYPKPVGFLFPLDCHVGNGHSHRFGRCWFGATSAASPWVWADSSLAAAAIAWLVSGVDTPPSNHSSMLMLAFLLTISPWSECSEVKSFPLRPIHNAPLGSIPTYTVPIIPLTCTWLLAWFGS